MLQKLINCLRGSVRLEVSGAFPERFVNLCAQRGIPFWGMEWLDANTLPTDEGDKGFATDRFTGETKRPGMFAGGDAAAHGSRVVINAIADGKKAAAGIDRYLGGSGVLNKGEEIDIPVIPVGDVAEHKRFPTRTLGVADRVDNFREVAQGYHNLDAMAECLRCLHCDRR